MPECSLQELLCEIEMKREELGELLEEGLDFASLEVAVHEALKPLEISLLKPLLQKVLDSQVLLSRLKELGGSLGMRFKGYRQDDLVAFAESFVGRAVKRNEKSVFYTRVRISIIEIIESHNGRMRRKIGVRNGNIGAGFQTICRFFQFVQRRFVEINFAVRLITRTPTVIRAVFERVKSFVRFIQTEMIRALIARKQIVCHPFQTDGVSQSFRKNSLIFAVRVHFQNRCADFFLFITGVTRRTDRNIKFAVWRKSDCSR
jgi:hypothetical protein